MIWVEFVFYYFVELLFKGTFPSLLQTIVPDDFSKTSWGDTRILS